MGNRKWSFKSKEDETQQISNSVYVTNFPGHVCAHDLWKIFNDYGSVIDVFIPLKKSMAAKRFAFIRFIKVVNLEHLIENLCTIWIGSFHHHANIVRFQREQKPKTITPNVSSSRNSRGTFASILKGGNPKQVSSDHSEPMLVLDDLCNIDRDFSMSLMGQRIVWVSVEGLPINAWSNNTFSKVASKWGELVEWEDLEENSLPCKQLCLKTNIDVIINERFKIILKGKVYWIRAKELDAWVLKFLSDKIDDYSSYDESNDVDEGGNSEDKEFEKSIDDNDIDRFSESSCMRGDDFVHEKITSIHSEETPHSNDPFNIYKLLNKNDNGVIPASDKVNVTSHNNSRNVDVLSQYTTSVRITGGSILDVMDDLIKVGQTMGYNMDGCLKIYLI
ncbi:RNA-directed DNA polymerase, eukaryota [Tanacetum coccineum]